MAKIKKCKTCNYEIASSAKSCPSCGAKNKKPIYKRGWFIVIAFFIVIGTIGAMGDDKSHSTNDQTVAQDQEITQNSDVEQNVPTQDKAEDSVPQIYKTALKKAKTYSDTMSMSKAGCI